MRNEHDQPPPQWPNPAINDALWARALTVAAVAVLTRLPRRLRKRHPHGVLFASRRFCIKVRPGGDLALAEAHAMRLVARHTSVPVPRVYCAFTHRSQGYIVMERVDGEMAWRAWMRRPAEARRRILEQLKGMVQQVRAIPPPTAWASPTPLKFHESLRNGIVTEGVRNVPDDLRELVEFHETPDPGPVVFTHGDLSSLNVLVRGDQVVAIIDWETAGWLPAYWEYACAWNVNPQNEFWRHEVDKFLDPMPYELGMEAIRRKYFGDF
ncbi:kinase-like domain-containing protein [Purpureocillium lavendulum]|uniref:Kinase-like domain-containing protein n=1 Tax=Purpureocillium lavendulum TaxID=1247861 RepID=A0AB34G1K0_9HYPO|nr:kinase-like domain-containing protein [Purpureocillium lavendulum]